MNILHSLIQKYKDSEQKKGNKKEFDQLLLQAVSDGEITDSEIEGLNLKKEEFGLTEDDIKSFKANIYLTAYQTIKNDGTVTKEEEEELDKIQKYLGIDEGELEITGTKEELRRYRLLNEIQQGNVPTTTVQNLILEKDEKAYWSEPAGLVEEKVIKSQYVGGSRGVSLRIMKGVSYRVGSYKGHIESQSANVIVSNGSLVITNKRLIFDGQEKSFSMKLNKILSIEPYNNGLFITQNSVSKRKMIKYASQENYQIISAILSYAINHYDA